MEIKAIKFITTNKVRVFFLEGDPCDYRYKKVSKGTSVDINGISHILFKNKDSWNIIEEEFYEARV